MPQPLGAVPPRSERAGRPPQCWEGDFSSVDPPVNRVFAATTGTERQIVIGGFGLAKHLELESLSGLHDSWSWRRRRLRALHSCTAKVDFVMKDGSSFVLRIINWSLIY